MKEDCKPPFNLTVKCPHCKVMDVTSHEYQMEGFVYTCVILLFYLLLTTIFMVKIICVKKHDGNGNNNFDEEKKKNDANQVVKKFREREKQKTVNSIFEIHTRKQFKKQMIGYLNSMNVSDINFNRCESQDESTMGTTIESMMISQSKTEENLLKSDASEQSTQTDDLAARKIAVFDNSKKCRWKFEDELQQQQEQQQKKENDNKSNCSVEFYL